MLKTLYIKNFVLIDELLLEFKDGFNVLLGETGAGKSIIIRAIDVALGAKTSKEALKNQEKHALIELTFIDKNSEIVISREISQTGTKCRINGALVTLEDVKNQRENLIDIHSQFQTYTYMQQKFHIDLLDSYIAAEKSDYQQILDEQNKNYKRYIELNKKINQIIADNKNNDSKIEFLKFQIDEIQKAEIQQNEQEELNRELEVLSNVQQLKELSYGSYFALNSEENSIIQTLNRLGCNISKAANFDENLKETEEIFFNALENLKDVSNTLRNYSENLADDPRRLDEISQRLELIEKLKRKYGDVFESCQNFMDELAALENETNVLEDLQKECFELEKVMNNACQNLTKIRSTYAKELSCAVKNELEKLEFTNPEFSIFQEHIPLGAKGEDKIEFLIKTNAAKQLAPLVKAASGGEISRVMLALKMVFANADNLSTVIFDEIDSGISGKTSVSVANEIFELSKTLQVFAITHQPIIASKAQNAFWVSKKQFEKDTQINVTKLDEQGKIQALAQMSAGVVDEKSLNFAKELLS